MTPTRLARATAVVPLDVLRLVVVRLLVLVLCASAIGCGGDGMGSPGRADAGPDAAADVRPDAAAEAAVEVPSDLPSPPDLHPGVSCTPSAPGLGAICGFVYRSATLPVIPSDPRADGVGQLLILPWDCDPFLPSDDPAACGARKPQGMGSPVVFDPIDLSKPNSDREYRILDVKPGTVHIFAVLVETPHNLDGGFLPGDTLLTPTPHLPVAAGASVQRSLKLTAMAREIKATISVHPSIAAAPGDRRGPAVLVAYGMPPGAGLEPSAFGLVPAATLPATISVVVLQPKTFYLNAIFDEDDSSMGGTVGDAIVTPGDLLHLGGVPVTIDPTQLTGTATIALDEVSRY